MAYRIFISLIVIICAYLAFETVRYAFLQNSLLNEEPEYVLGNPEGDVTFVKFLDYSCKFCRDAHPVVNAAVKRDGNVKYLPRPVETLTSEGIKASLLPYAAAKQGKFIEMHDALMENYRVIDDQVIQDLALQIGIDHEQLKRDIEDKNVIKKADKNMDLFNDYRLNATPAYAVGKGILLVPDRTFNENDFLTLFKEARGQ